MELKAPLPPDQHHKKCSRCKIVKPASQFNKNKNANDGLGFQCKVCSANYQKSKRDPAHHLLRQYNLTQAEYDALLASQNYCCAICKKTVPDGLHKKFYVDHCHSTGRVRGLLCLRCNVALGTFEKHILPRLDFITAYIGDTLPGELYEQD